ncbi:TetR/AcrR family transcriptional regulator [Pontixanthobacter aquaemixtae]|uniref:TetR/AcrR family transcriptional regulator n=1 Tax=Pontixanthobacter aquaemixtae TaxID=1958940 RepID=UPI00136C1A1E|nr:TetR/AcrR family transcriptional regulator [Pontixanthobacter aquaemixtae]
MRVALDRAQRAKVVHNLQGQKLGRKGQITRAKIIAAAQELIAESDDPNISLSAVARVVGIGMTSLYNYFADLSELVLALLELAMEDADEAYIHHLSERWSDETLAEDCRKFVTNFAEFWARNANLLHVRNYLADQRNQQMIHHRVLAAKQVGLLLTMQMDTEPDGRDSMTQGMATALYIAIERVSSVLNNGDLPADVDGSFRPKSTFLLEAQSHLLEMGLRSMREQNRG